ncbi:hypothetical protein [Anabaena sp. CCY 9613]|uniref:hypothetical protein n=1 Tax=Anabaena sp. CCY 9613 TaxID=3103868 RepID=UPI0039C65CFC
MTCVKISPLLGNYGVHTSREIPPDTWFRPLALGCAMAYPPAGGDRSESLALRGGTT